MPDDLEPPRRDTLLYCGRCRRVTAHYLAETPTGDQVWMCNECALIDVLAEIRTFFPLTGNPAS